MDFSLEILKISEKISSLQFTLQSICPKLTVSKMRETISPISSNLAETSSFSSLHGIVYSLSFAGHGSSLNPEGKSMLATVTDMGEVTIWNTLRGRAMFRTNVLASDPWLLTCAFEQQECSLLAAGGVEGKLHLFRLEKNSSHELTLTEHPLIRISAHDNYISKCEFLTSTQVLSASGDCCIKLWSLLPSQDPIRVFKGHSEDVMSLATNSSNLAVFITGACDSTIKIWDVRDPKGNVHTYHSHIGHINALKFFKDSEFSFVSARSDGYCMLYDTRTLREIGKYGGNSKEMCEVIDVVTSNSGRMLVAADEIGRIRVWDIFDERVPVQSFEVHESKINCMEISANGSLIATAGMDSCIKFIENAETRG